jgi:hypothetical protein
MQREDEASTQECQRKLPVSSGFYTRFDRDFGVLASGNAAIAGSF